MPSPKSIERAFLPNNIRQRVARWVGGPVNPKRKAMKATITAVSDDGAIINVPSGERRVPFTEIADADKVIRLFATAGGSPVWGDLRNPDSAFGVRPIYEPSYARALAERIRSDSDRE